jgi:hypothetical protein
LPPRWGWSQGNLIARGATTTTWMPPLQILTLKIENEAPKTRTEPSHRRGSRSTVTPWPKGHRDRRPAMAPVGGNERSDRPA